MITGVAERLQHIIQLAVRKSQCVLVGLSRVRNLYMLRSAHAGINHGVYVAINPILYSRRAECLHINFNFK